jgi:protein-S-isoprenylcysteine O-methyltransferase Ste14
MKQLLVRLYAVGAYAAFLAVFLYLIGFVAGWGVPKSVDDGVATPVALAVAVDVALVLFFGLLHSVMARAHFKRVWTKLVPPSAERSTYVLVASAQIALLCWQWRPIGPALWDSRGAFAVAVRALQLGGWGIAILSTYLVDHFELFGLRQAFGGGAQEPVLRTPLLYRWVRHPLYFGMLVGLWSAPTMSVGHFLLSSLLTGYILVGVRHEERDLVRVFGDAYRRYQATVPMLLPLPRRTSARRLAGAPASE